MRHRTRAGTLGRTASHRTAMYRNMVTSLLDRERIETTDAKAKTVRRLAERMITLGKRGDLHARRRALRIIRSRKVAAKVFDDLAERFRDRPGGYTRVIKLRTRVGDAAPMSIVELVEGESAAKTARKTAAKKGEKAAATGKKATRKKTAAGEKAAVDFALGELRSLFGPDVDRSFVAGRFTGWGSDANVRGAYAVAKPGGQKAREQLAQSHGDRLFFAGEALAGGMATTVGGAFMNGRQVADIVAREIA